MLGLTAFKWARTFVPRASSLATANCAHVYNREQLLRLRKQPVLERAAQVCKHLGLFKFRGKRAGAHVRDFQNKKTGNVLPQLTKKRVDQDEVNLNYCLLNARSIKNKSDELAVLTTQEDSTVVVITETWLNDQIPDESFCPTPYYAYRSDRSQGKERRRGGGVCTLTKTPLQSHAIPCHGSHLKTIDCCITWNRYPCMPRDKNAIINWAIYIPPNQTKQNAELIKEHIALTCNELSLRYRDAKFILAGDFNNVNVYNVATALGLKQIVQRATRGTRTLDQIWTNVQHTKVDVLAPIASSDHATVSVKFKISADRGANEHRTRWIRRQTEQDIEECGKKLMQTNWDFLRTADDLNRKCDRFNQFIIDAADHYFPKIKLETKARRSKPWLNDKLARLFKQRNVAYKKNDLPRYKELVTEIKEEIVNVKSNFYKEKIQGNRNKEPKKWHNMITELGGFSKKKKTTQCETNIDELNLFFANMGKSQIPYVPKEMPPALPVKDKPSIEQYETSRMLRNIELAKAQPSGDIPAFVLKKFHVELAEPVTLLFNESLHQAVIPHGWSTFEIIPIPKIKNPKNPQDWRPIAISKVLFKCLDKYIATVLRASTNPLLSKNQYGGKPNRSCEHYLIAMSEFIHANVDKGRVVSLQTIDQAKAYNSTHHQILIEKVQTIPSHPIMLNWVRTLILTMTQVTMDNETRTVSNEVSIECGIPQGTSLAPSLYTWYTNDIPMLEGLWAFIDDTTTGSEGDTVREAKGKAQEKLDALDEWLRMNLLTVNTEKCANITFDFRRKRDTIVTPPLTIASQPIKETVSVKILGVTFQGNLKWDIHVKAITNKAYRQMYLLHQLAKYKVSKRDLNAVYKAYVRPQLEYSGSIWGHSLTMKEKKKVERIQKRATSLITKQWNNSYQENLDACGLTTLEERRDMLSLRLAKRLIGDREFEYLFPPQQGSISGINTRSSTKLAATVAKTTRRMNSPVPTLIRLLNKDILT